MNDKIDKNFSEKMLKKLNNHEMKTYNVSVKNFPDVRHKEIFDLSKEVFNFKFKKELVENNLKNYINNFKDFGQIEDDYYTYSRLDLEELGLALYSYLSFGVLNGGAATSYVDKIKNKEFNPSLFSIFESKINEAKLKYGDLPKGITPAYINKNGEFGYSFFALKIRHLLNISKKYESKYGIKIKPSIFQMTSAKTDQSISNFLDGIFEDKLIKEINSYGLNKKDILTAVQPLVYCYRKLENDEYEYFTYKDRDGKEDILALPAGHGQNFRVLKDIYIKLHNEGKRFAYIGNVDNIGLTVNFKALALMAITNSSSGFEFSIKTKLDTKGGILVLDNEDDLTCVDIGSAISKEDVDNAEKDGNKILFNCATGLFNLEYLIKNIDRIIEYMPTRLLEQNKEIGKYTLIEQITWEVLKIFEQPLIFAVNRSERFLPAKLFIDMLISSNYLGDKYPSDVIPIADYLNTSLNNLLKNDYALIKKGDKWDI